MKICLVCGAEFKSKDWICPICHNIPQIIDGYPAFAPDFSEKNDGFNIEDFEVLASLEAKNFWFRSRNRLIIWALCHYFAKMENFLEIGCGTGFVLSGIEKAFPKIDLFGSEIYNAGLSYAAQRLERASLFQMDARCIPFKAEFDVIGAFDVLEHIQEDEAVLSQMYKALKPGGGIIITVPQHPSLWSWVDERACHVRRYTACDMINKLEACGFSILRKTSFVSLLLPLIKLTRLSKTKKKKECNIVSGLKTNRLLDLIFEKILGIERGIIRLGGNLPIGSSLLIVAKKEL